MPNRLKLVIGNNRGTKKYYNYSIKLTIRYACRFHKSQYLMIQGDPMLQTAETSLGFSPRGVDRIFDPQTN